ncbi:MAG: OmpA family protein [Cyanobacteria bacterium J06634_6]
MGDSKISTNMPESLDSQSPDAVSSELQALRELILGGSPDELLHPKVSAESLSELLPEAMTKAQERGPELLLATLPAVESAIQSSVKADEHVLAEALFPVIGPATRQSIASAIGNLVQSLNQTLEHSLSPQSFMWRLEARRTGKSFAEVVLIRTLVYQVEQLFLIHRETGLVIQHVVAESATAKDPDLVSAMLTAIQDFIQDSFDVNKEDVIDSLKLGDFTLLVEEGPQAIIAGVVRGTPPNDLSELLRSQLEKIHLHFDQALHSFDGDQDAFTSVTPYLEDCFQSQFKGRQERKKRQYTLNPTIKRLGKYLVGIALLGFATWAGLNWWSNRQWHQFVSQVRMQPGLVVISEHKQRGNYYLQGLRDPLAADPAQLLQSVQLKPHNVNMSWSNYLSLDSAFLSKRTHALFSPPETASVNLTPEGVLQVSGRAPAAWIAEAKQISQQVEGITGWLANELLSLEQETINQLRGRIEYRRFGFQLQNAELRSPYFQTRYLETLQNQAKDISALVQVAQSIDRQVTINIVGHGDGRDQGPKTLQLAQSRADVLKQYLVSQGISAEYIRATGAQIPSSDDANIDPISPAGERGAASFQVQLQ